MKRKFVKNPVCAATAEKSVEVEVTFAGMGSAAQCYTVEDTEHMTDEDIINAAVNQAADDLEGELLEDGEVEVSFAGMVGVTETYSTDADDDEEAQIDDAIEQATFDLSGEISE